MFESIGEEMTLHNKRPTSRRISLLVTTSVIVAAVAAVAVWSFYSTTKRHSAVSIRLSTESKPTPDDQDADDLKDDYELVFFHKLDESTDVDKDGLPDKLEMRLYGSLTHTEDKDRDGLPDAWEIAHFGNLVQTSTGDPDGDGLTNLQELARGRGFNPARPTKVVAWKDAKASANVAGQQSIAGPGKRAADGKIYYRKTYDRLVKQGKFDVPWEKLP